MRAPRRRLWRRTRAAAAEPSAAEPRPAEPSAARGEGDRARHQLARVRRADRSPIALLERPTALRSTPGGRSVARLETETEFDSPRVLAVLDDRPGWLEVMAPELPNGDSGWIRAGVAALGGTSYSLRESLSDRELEVRRHDRVVRRVTVAVGLPGPRRRPGPSRSRTSSR